MVGGIEAGGTKFVCSVGSGSDYSKPHKFSTTSPTETVAEAAAFFRQYKVDALGIGCFGPIDIAGGRITTTPKPGWQYFSIVDAMRQATGIDRIVFDTDVNAAALGEHRWGAAQGVNDFIYLTVGTGVGGGAMANGRLLHGKSHPEMGHVRIRRDSKHDSRQGYCYAHGDCLEGLASGEAIRQRWGQPGEQLPPDHEAWRLETDYLAEAMAIFTLILSPVKIIAGGSVMRSVPYPLLASKVGELLKGYVSTPEIVPPALGDDAGVRGAIALAELADLSGN